MAGAEMDRQLLEQLSQLAAASPVPLADLSMEEMASALGMTRMTLYRKAGTRAQIVQALGEHGIDARRQPDVFDRVVVATATLLRERPIADMTLETIASHADCSLPALYARFGGREGVLKAVIERHSPLHPMKRVITTEMESETPDLRHDVKLLYRTVFTTLSREWPVVRSFLAELLRNPQSEVGHAVRDWYVPQASVTLLPLIEKHMEQGTMRRLPVPIVVQWLAAPMGLHVASRGFITNETELELPDIDTTIDLFTEMFCRAVGTERPYGRE